MAAVDVIAVMNTDEKRNLHPFFTKVDGPAIILDDNVKDEQPTLPAIGKPSRGRPRTRKPKSDGHHDSKSQRTLNDIINPRPHAKEQENDSHDDGTDSDFESTSRKRRKTSVGNFMNLEHDPEAKHESEGASETVGTPADSLPKLVPVIFQPEQLPKPPPKKTLRLNANGRFSSPVIREHGNSDPRSSSGRQTRPKPQRSIERSMALSLIVKFHYATSGEAHLGLRITKILQGDERIKTTIKATKSRNRKSVAAIEVGADTHPFFQTKSTQSILPKPSSPRKMLSATTPGKLRMQALNDSPRVESREPTYIVGSDLLKDRLMFKHPGAKEPALPDKEQMHVRGIDVLMPQEQFGRVPPHFTIRKRKQAKRILSETESVTTHFASRLTCEDDRRVRPDGFLEPSRDLTVPQRLLLCGADIAQRVLKQMSSQYDLAVDELGLPSSQAPAHPAVQHLLSQVPSVMTAYDESKGEVLQWTQKYAPRLASDVLQPEREMTVLKDWLKATGVHSVSGAAAGKVGAPLLQKPKKKRKKKNAEMDDFLVESDEDDSEMHDLCDDQNVDGPIGGGKSTPKSIVRSVNPGDKLNNTVLISGPSGCGKTAAAYAIARELGYKVFEISSSERRSGKDVLDKIGNMAENHLVKHHGTGPAVSGEHNDTASVDEPAQFDEAFQRDLESGRQGKMNAFFKPQPKTNPAQPKNLPTKGQIAAKAIKDVQEVLKKPSKDQQQSLILLEEVDIMFKDDKEFWPTILKLISTSKRPFLMTCNDETLLPVQAIGFHAMLRFESASREIATDYMLAVAATEGHLIDRDAISWLYDYHNQDLRASLTELDFWCQMAVGDPRSGLTWIYQRWPPGADVDDKGRKLRVVSQGTYTKGMSLTLGRDLSIEDAVAWAWRELDIEPATALGWHELTLGCDSPQSPLQKLQDLKSFSRYEDTLSASDVIHAKQPFNTLLCDPSRRPLTDQHRTQYIEGHRLLQTDAHTDDITLTFNLAVTMSVAATRTCDLLDSISLTNPITIRDTILSRKSTQEGHTPMTRRAFACFDTLAYDPESTLPQLTMLQSVFDGPLRPIAMDIAPFVRSIVRYDEDLAEHRDQLNTLLSEGRAAKKARTTRAARSALEGGERSSTRREKWFVGELNAEAVLATGGNDWVPPSTTRDLSVSSAHRSMEEDDSH